MKSPFSTDGCSDTVASKQRVDEFNSWMGQPLVALMLSKLPSFDPPELLETMLRSAFDAGVQQGQREMILEIARHTGIIGDKKRGI